ncbi:MAG: hypothetical protein K5831_16715 [Brevundimonas sp.]|uniref:Uncharacterized protein n=1 Tax=Brevundimonas albigilva TaxID=1312364 RepID=A0ABY4SL34_9CAUL|nr:MULTISPECIES: hypothetical protein [Brevundimonas]MCV0416508.1 hypothetical protein [Brevundimonas sp.]URI14984.1 hypothetical protein M8231_14450 [Brevundimonas albigilva]
MDLAELSWINLSVPVVGDFRLPIFSGEFSDWAAKGRWSDGQSFMLSMLTTLARTLPADGQLDQQALSALAPEDVDAIAEQIIDKTGSYFFTADLKLAKNRLQQTAPVACKRCQPAMASGAGEVLT